MKLADNMQLQAEAMKRIGFPPSMPAEHLTYPNFNRLIEAMSALKASAGPYQSVAICADCYAVHDCPFGARHENAFHHTKVCRACGNRSGFEDVVGCWISFARFWHLSTWHTGCWAFDFCTSPGRNRDGTLRAGK